MAINSRDSCIDTCVCSIKERHRCRGIVGIRHAFVDSEVSPDVHLGIKVAVVWGSRLYATQDFEDELISADAARIKLPHPIIKARLIGRSTQNVVVNRISEDAIGRSGWVGC